MTRAESIALFKNLDGVLYWYQQTSKDITKNEGDEFEPLDVLNRNVGVFSDWPATTGFYASCVGLTQQPNNWGRFTGG